MFIRFLALIAPIVLALAAPVAADAPAPDARLEALRVLDARLMGIAFHLASANVALCPALAPTPGFVLHTLTQYPVEYRPGARRVFGFVTSVAVEAVVPEGPAARAGVRPGDGVLAIGGVPLPTSIPDDAPATLDTRDAAIARLVAQPLASPIALTLLRDGRRIDVRLPVSPGCRMEVEVTLDRALNASADGTSILVGARLLERYDDAQIAVVVAHEMAHVVLNHRARLRAVGVKHGLAAEFGRSAGLIRQTERDADVLGLYLLTAAGYDPASAARFWRGQGATLDGGVFHGASHPAAAVRAATLDREAAAIAARSPEQNRVYARSLLARSDASLR